MPTTLYAKYQGTLGGVFGTTRPADLLNTASGDSNTNSTLDWHETGAVDEEALPDVTTDGHATLGGFYSLRTDATADLSGQTITFEHYVDCTGGSGATNATLRFKLSKLIRGGTDQEIAIADFHGQAQIVSGAAVLKSWSYTLPSNTVLSVEERLILRIALVPLTAGTSINTSWTYTMPFNSTTSVLQMRVLLPDVTLTFLPNYTRLYLRNTTATGIGAFMDLSTAGGTSTATAVVNTALGPTEIQWTKTAGGAVAEWVSPRFNKNFYIDNPSSGIAASAMRAVMTAFESATQANAGSRVKVWRLRNGVETLIATMNDVNELSTSATARTMDTVSNSTLTPTEMKADDRLVVRVYIKDTGGTMASGRTCTLNYNGSAASARPYLDVFEGGGVKAEGDPASVETVPDGMTTLGLGN